MKQLVYSGSYGPEILAGEIPFSAGIPVEVADDVATLLLAKPHFTEAPAAAVAKTSPTGKE